MKAALWLAAAALQVAAQPKLLVNAKVDTRSAAAGLEREFKAALAAQPQPAWIGYSVPVADGRGLGCELVAPDGWWAPGVVHLEPPEEMLVIFRVENGAAQRVRALSPDCQIDARGLPVHWLSGVDAGQSDALLTGLAQTGAEPGLRADAVGALGRSSGPKAPEVIAGVIANDPEARVKRRAVAALQELPGGKGVPVLIRIARTTRDSDIRRQAMSILGQTKDPQAIAFFEQVLK